MIASNFVGASPKPAATPPMEGLLDVTNGYVPKSRSSMVALAPCDYSINPEIRFHDFERWPAMLVKQTECGPLSTTEIKFEQIVWLWMECYICSCRFSCCLQKSDLAITERAPRKLCRPYSAGLCVLRASTIAVQRIGIPQRECAVLPPRLH